MTRLLLGCFLALSLGFVSGCGGSGETTVVDSSGIDAATQAAEDEAYEAEMAAQEDQGK